MAAAAENLLTLVTKPGSKGVAPPCVATVWIERLRKRHNLLISLVAIPEVSTLPEGSLAITYAKAYLAMGLGEAFKYVGKIKEDGTPACFVSITPAEGSSGGKRYYQISKTLLARILPAAQLASFRDLFLHGREEMFLNEANLATEVKGINISELSLLLMSFHDKMLPEALRSIGVVIAGMEFTSFPEVGGTSSSAVSSSTSIDEKSIDFVRPKIVGASMKTRPHLLDNLNFSKVILDRLLSAAATVTITATPTSSDSTTAAVSAELPLQEVLLYSMALSGAYLSFFQAAADCFDVMKRNLTFITDDLRGYMNKLDSFRNAHAHCFKTDNDPLVQPGPSTEHCRPLSHWIDPWKNIDSVTGRIKSYGLRFLYNNLHDFSAQFENWLTSSSPTMLLSGMTGGRADETKKLSSASRAADTSHDPKPSPRG